MNAPVASAFAHALRALPQGSEVVLELVSGEVVEGALLVLPHGDDFVEVDGWIVAIAHVARFKRST